ncbi:hypothetical protein [uncultured Ruegeria sp.]|uniref:hypothetical protein n=1 Tax=uncultured Ruegeria sp. TaxID=259304 RepID=UPI0026171846|nr:hypothetical protein [uncultured Ruegeria sp.]
MTIIACMMLAAPNQVQAASDDAFGIEIAKLCRSLVQSDRPIAEGLLNNGFALAEGAALDAVAELMSYRRRLERAAGTTYVPDPEDFPTEKDKALATLRSLKKISFTSVLIHPERPDYYVNTQEKPKRTCSFTYVGSVTDWPQRLGFTSENSISFEERFAEGRDLSVKVIHGPKDGNSNLGLLIVTGPSLNAGSVFGGTEFVTRWSVSP